MSSRFGARRLRGIDLRDLFSAAAASSTSEHGLSQNGGEFSATHFWVKMKLKATMAKLFWGHIGTLFFLPWFPLRNQRDVRNVLDSLIPFKESNWCDWILFFPWLNQFDSFKESNWFRIQGLWSSVSPGANTERKMRFIFLRTKIRYGIMWARFKIILT